MKILRLFRNIAALFIFGAALLSSLPMGATQPIKNTCYFDSKTVGYNCTFNTDGTCSSSRCKSGQPCNNGVCGQPIEICEPNKCCFCNF